MAAKYGHTETVKVLIAANANVNHQNPFGDTALMMAARTAAITVQALIAAKADVNLSDTHGNTALTEAARSGRTAIVIALIKASANVNHTNNDKKTALIMASEKGRLEAAYVFLEDLVQQDIQASQPSYLPSARPTAQIPTSSSSNTETASPSSEMKLGG